MTQLELDYRRHASGQTQKQKILRELLRMFGEWVEMPVLWRVSGAFAVHSRIADLRRDGFEIEHKNKWDDGICKSFYRLVEEQAYE